MRAGIARYRKDNEPDKEGTVKYGPFMISGTDFIAMASALDHKFSFIVTISFMVY